MVAQKESKVISIGVNHDIHLWMKDIADSRGMKLRNVPYLFREAFEMLSPKQRTEAFERMVRRRKSAATPAA
jgi:hypothetical protein